MEIKACHIKNYERNKDELNCSLKTTYAMKTKKLFKRSYSIAFMTVLQSILTGWMINRAPFTHACTPLVNAFCKITTDMLASLHSRGIHASSDAGKKLIPQSRSHLSPNDLLMTDKAILGYLESNQGPYWDFSIYAPCKTVPGPIAGWRTGKRIEGV